MTRPIRSSSKRNRRWQWMAGAMAASAAAAPASHAKTVQINLVNNIVYSTFGPDELNGDLTGDGIDDVTLSTMQAGGSGNVRTVTLKVNGVALKAKINQYGVEPGSLTIYGPNSVVVATQTGSYNIRDYYLPVTFSDGAYNKRASTHGFVEISINALSGTVGLQLNRLIFDDASTKAPVLGVPTSHLTSPTAPAFPVVGTVENGQDPKRSTRSDFDQNHSPDLVLFNAATGATTVELFNAYKVSSTATGPAIPAGYKLIGLGDFNGDGQPDYLLEKTSSRALSVWFLDGVTFSTSCNILNPANAGVALPAGWKVAAVTDMNGNGQPDLVLFNPTSHNVSIYYLAKGGTAAAPTVTFKSSTFVKQGTANAVFPSGWQVVGAADFNGDGKPDLALFNPSNSMTAVYYLNGTTVTTHVLGPTITGGGQVVGVADYNTDSKPDFLLYYPATGECGVWTLNGVTYAGGKYLTDSTNAHFVVPAGSSIVAP